MKLLRHVHSMMQTAFGRIGTALVLGFTMQPLMRVWAQPLRETKDLFDRIQSPNNLSSNPTNININPFQSLYDDIRYSTSDGGFDGLMSILNQVLQAGITLVSLAAVIFVIVAGVRMVIESNNEDTAKKQMTMIFNILVGIVIMNVAHLAVQWVAPDTSATRTVDLLSRFDTVDGVRQSAVGISTLVIFPLLDFALSFLAGIALLFLVYAGLQIILARGEEEKIKEARGRILKVVLGLAVILLNKALVGVFYGSVDTNVSAVRPRWEDVVRNSNLPQIDTTAFASPGIKPDLQAGIDLAFNIANYILGFLGLVAVVALIYGGILIVSSGGESQRREQGLKILRYVIFGLIMAMSAYTLTSAIIGATIRAS